MATADSSERKALSTRKKAATPRATPKPRTGTSRPPGYATTGTIKPGPRKVTGYTLPNPPYGVVLGRPGKVTTKPTVRMEYTPTPSQKPMGRPTKPRNKGLSQPDRAEGYGKPGGKWVPSGRRAPRVPNSNWNDLDSQITMRDIPKWVPDGAKKKKAVPRKTPKRKPASDGYDTTRSPRQGNKPPAKKPAPPKLIDVYVNGRVVKVPISSPRQGNRSKMIPRIPGSL